MENTGNNITELLSIVLEESKEEGLRVIVQPAPGIENVLPEGYIDFVCREIGGFMQNSLKQLKVVEKKEEN
jgi:hypothetical protein